MAAELVYRYARPSSIGHAGLVLATSASVQVPEPYFRGFLERPDMSSAALLCVARVARTRFYVPPGGNARGLADPVVTSETGALRFESFSACCGVHARFDVLPDGLDAETASSGTVNVDFNEPMRAALARVVARTPLRMQVGFDAVEVETLEGSAVERRVPLPERWVKGFSEVQVAVAGLEPVFELTGVAAQRFVRGLPRGPGGKATLWVKASQAGVRLGARAGGGAVCVAAPERLRVLEPVARYMTVLRAYAVPDEEKASVWVAELPGARLLVTLSPHFSRGFSGEGGLLEDLADDALAIEAEFLDRALHGRRRFSDAELTSTGLDLGRGRRALSWLGARGRIGFDPVERVWFRRELPFPSEALEADPPRLRDARQLVQQDAVRLAPGGEGADVRSGDKAYAVRLRPPRCSCPWWSKHPGDRGPCKHLLAAQIAAARLAPTGEHAPDRAAPAP
jgi:SWIM zinc finger